MEQYLQNDGRWLTRKQAAQYAGKSLICLDKWRKKHPGAFDIKLPTGSVLIDRIAFDKWLTDNKKI